MLRVKSYPVSYHSLALAKHLVLWHHRTKCYLRKSSNIDTKNSILNQHKYIFYNKWILILKGLLLFYIYIIFIWPTYLHKKHHNNISFSALTKLTITLRVRSYTLSYPRLALEKHLVLRHHRTKYYPKEKH